MPEPRFSGQRITLGGTEYTVPPLALGQVKKLLPQISALSSTIGSGTITAEQVDIGVELVLAALSRNYPDITREQLEEVLDLGNFKDVTEAVMAVSGLTRKNAEPGAATTATT